MILLFNVKITRYGLSYYHRSRWLPQHTRMDIFKYCLASYVPMIPLLDKCLFYITVEPEFAYRQPELEQYIRELFPSDKTEIHWQRINYSREWREFCDKELPDDQQLIWFAGNDDHIFIDHDLDMLESGIDLLKNDGNPYSAIYYSHWPEQMRLSHHHGGELTPNGDYIKFKWRTFDAIRIIKAARFKKYWADNDFGNTMVFRTDHLYHSGYELTSDVYAPTREMVRHYDGYSHVNTQIVNLVPPLVIPEGFFQRDIKIRLGNFLKEPGYTILNPRASLLYAADPTGADYRWVLEDIPLFWKDRISSIEIDDQYNLDDNLLARDFAYLTSTRIPMNCYQIAFGEEPAHPIEWFTKHCRHDKYKLKN